MPSYLFVADGNFLYNNSAHNNYSVQLLLWSFLDDSGRVPQLNHRLDARKEHEFVDKNLQRDANGSHDDVLKIC